jgi:hypothetical protein
MLYSAVLGLAKSQQSVKTSFGKLVCELKAAELDCPSSVPKTGLYGQGIQAVSIKLKSLVITMPTRVVLTRVVPTRVVQSYSKEVQFLPTFCEQRVTYLVIAISDLEFESMFLEHPPFQIIITT